MALPSFCNDTVTVLRPTMVTKRGVSVPDWTNAISHDVARCSLQDGKTSTDFATSQRFPTTSDAVLLAPPNADIRDGDRVTFGERTWEVDGVPFAQRSPTGKVSHVRANLKEWRG